MAEQAFKLVSPYQPTGDQPEAIEKLVEGGGAGGPLSNPAGGHRQRQDLYHGQCDCPVQPAHPGAGPQQDPGRPAVYRVPGPFSPRTRWSTLSPTTTTTSPRPISPAPTPTLRRTAPSMTRSTACAIRRRRLCPSGGMSSLWRRLSCIYSWATPSTTGVWSSACAPAWR